MKAVAFGCAVVLVFGFCQSIFASSSSPGLDERPLFPDTPAVGPDSGPSAVSIWEAYAKGNATIQQLFDNATWDWVYNVTNRGSISIEIDESVMLLNPHPLEASWAATTQDGTLMNSTVPPGQTVSYHTDWAVLNGYATEPVWWCTELYQGVTPDVFVRLGGETLPHAMEAMTSNWNNTTQYDLWDFLEANPALVVGKTPLWKSVAGTAGTTVQITVAVTNLAVYNGGYDNGSQVEAFDSVVVDTIPAGYAYDPSSLSPTPFEIANNSDGSTSLEWRVTLPGADYSQTNGMDPTPYQHTFLNYSLVLPSLSSGRHFLPRASVDTDADGVEDAHSARPLLETYASNQAPVADANGPYNGYEGTPLTFDASMSSDPDNDSLMFRWDFDSDGSYDTSWSSSPYAASIWGDDYSGKVTLEVTDGDLTSTDTADVTILNLPPTADPSFTTSVQGSLTLRVAGEKWHDVNLTIYRDGVAVASVSVIRFPGSPDDQAATIENVTIDLLSGNLSAIVTYTPDDDPINGQPNGANPAWLIFTARDGSQSRIHHTFNVRHNDTWVWRVDDLRALLAGASVTFTATATDPGSDDLTFTWGWGDGTNATTTTYFNDGIGPDPYPSPGGTFPFTATDWVGHSYAASGNYTVTLRVTDDDGGMKEITMVITIV